MTEGEKIVWGIVYNGALASDQRCSRPDASEVATRAVQNLRKSARQLDPPSDERFSVGDRVVIRGAVKGTDDNDQPWSFPDGTEGTVVLVDRRENTTIYCIQMPNGEWFPYDERAEGPDFVQKLAKQPY